MKKPLGRGLGALLGENDSFFEKFEQTADTETSNEKTPFEIPINQIVRNEQQPRKLFDESAMIELTNNIRLHGIIAPVIVVKRGDKYMVIAGERRWRAAQRAGLRAIPALVREYSSKQISEIALIENLQREDLNPIEIANAIRQLMDEHGYTQDEAARRIGKSRSLVANLLGLLTLPSSVVDLVASGRLSTGHAKILTSITDPTLQSELALKGVGGKMSVRKFEDFVRERKNASTNRTEGKLSFSIELQELIQNFQRVFATKVSAIGNDKRGRIYIDYFTRDDLDRFSEIIDGLMKKKI